MKPDHIIIHHSLTKDGHTVSWQTIRDYHMGVLAWKAIGYQYGIERINNIYEILKGRMDTECGAHCKQDEMNKRSIGICLIGNFDETTPDAVMMYKLVRLTRSLMNIHNIPIENIKPHNAFAKYKSCPGKNFNFNKFIEGLEKGGV